MADYSSKLKIVMGIVLGAFILTIILVALRGTALKNAYDATNGFNVTDSAGSVHTVAPSGFSGDTIALLYSLATGAVWLIAIVAVVLLLFVFK